MGHRTAGSESAEAMKEDLERWTAVIESFARGRFVRSDLEARSYDALYCRLIATCRVLSGSADESERVLSHKLEVMIRPWLSLSVIAKADGEILGHLLDRFRILERELGVGVRRRAMARVKSTLLCLIPAAIGFLAISRAGRSLWQPSAEALRQSWGLFWLSLKRANDFEKLYVIGVIMIIISIYSLTRTARS